MVVSRERLQTAGRNSWVWLVAGELLGVLEEFTDTSKLVTRAEATVGAFRASWTESVTERGTSRGVDSLHRFVYNSTAVAGGQRLALAIGRPVRTAVDRATITDITDWLIEAVWSSWLYRWLTAEPEPEVIVIDLRDTISVGPFIAFLDTALRTLVPASHRSTVGSVVESVHDHAKDEPVRLGSVLLFVATFSSLMVSLASGEPSQVGVIAHLVFLGLAFLGTRVTMTWDELVESRVAILVIAALEPPEPPEEFDDRDR